MQRKRSGVKGLSTIVSTLLILLLVFVAIGILWVVVRNVIQGGAEQVSLGKFTLDLAIDRVTINSAANTIDVKVTRNPGAGEFTGLRFILDDGTNTKVVEKDNITMNEYDSTTFGIPVPSGMTADGIQKIEIAPVFTLSSGKLSNGDVKATWNKPVSSNNNGGVVVGSNCGNSQIDSGEVCDGNLLGTGTCVSVLNNDQATGSLTCTSSCTYDTSLCSLPTCGNGQIDSTEQCDGNLLGSGTCSSALGVTATGTLVCGTTSCQYVTTGCTVTPVCGNGIKQSSEGCDDGNTASSDGCSASCVVESGYTCTENSTGFSTCTQNNLCGNGNIDGSEQCDTNNLNGGTCDSAAGTGYTGILKCYASGTSNQCTYDISGCTAPTSNTWSSSLVARWNFESGALGTDSVGSNNLYVNPGIVADTNNKKEGTSSMYINNIETHFNNYQANISDSALSSDFPLKSGTTNKAITVCSWVNIESEINPDGSSNFGYIFSKGETSTYPHAVTFVIFNKGPSLQMDVGFNNGANFSYVTASSTLSINQWYFFCGSYDDSTKAYRLRLYDSSGTPIGSDKTGTFSQNIYLGTYPIVFGEAKDGFHQFDGRIDKMMVFDKALTASEMDQVLAAS